VDAFLAVLDEEAVNGASPDGCGLPPQFEGVDDFQHAVRAARPGRNGRAVDPAPGGR
jgi:hypothetical protein